MSSLLDQSAPGYPDRVAGRLPSGRHTLPRESVVRSQHDRLLGAMGEICASDGYGGATVAAVVARAGVSRKTFYEHFTDREACFLAAFDAIISELLGAVISAYSGLELGWPDRVEAALAAVLSFLGADGAFARMCGVEVLAAGPRALERYTAATQMLAELLDQGRDVSPDDDDLPADTAVAVVHGCALVIRDEILAGRGTQLPELLPDLLYAVLAPYLGQDEALKRARESSP
jgi:AcrR family transcriptional regulator